MAKESDIRSTPMWFFNKLNEIFNFQLDVCATKENAKCFQYISEEQDGLVTPWEKVNWCNPPYSHGQLIKWLKKAAEEQKLGNTTVVLVPGDTSTKWYQDGILKQDRVSVQPVYQRLKFDNAGSGAKFASHIVIFWGWQ
jgi:phage N-6-adenine-methyltransferase